MEIGLLVISGILGSSHCMGMCGGFALALARPKDSLIRNLQRQAIYTFGRVATYGLLGAMAAWCGGELVHWQWLRNYGGALLAFLAGGLLLQQGVIAAGLWPQTQSSVSTATCGVAALLKPAVSGRYRYDAFIAGAFTGLIPCGLIYAMLAMAASTHDMLQGAVSMVAFGAGTAPAMVLIGLSGVAFPIAWRKRVWKLAAWCLVTMGLITVARGGYALLNATTDEPCPFCSTQTKP